MSDDRVRLDVEACCFGFFFTLVFSNNNVILYKRCVQVPLPYNNEHTDSRSTSIAQIYLDFFQV